MNAHNVAWQDDESYAQWRFGAVVDDVEASLGAALDQAKERHGEFVDGQTKAFNYTFRIEANSTAAERGADAIAAFLQGPGHTVSQAAHADSSAGLAIPDGFLVR